MIRSLPVFRSVRQLKSSLQEIIRSKNFALINLRLNFCETSRNDKIIIIENLLAENLVEMHKLYI